MAQVKKSKPNKSAPRFLAENVEPKLHQKFKMATAKNNTTMREALIEMVAKYCNKAGV